MGSTKDRGSTIVAEPQCTGEAVTDFQLRAARAT